MAKPPSPPPPPPLPSPMTRAVVPPPALKLAGAIDPFARMLAATVREAHGIDQGSTLDMSEEIGTPSGYIGTRNIALDRALGIPGIPLGRMTEISGWEGGGKSTMLDQILAQCQQEGGIAVLADTERARNRVYMEALGCRPESLVWIGGGTIELMFDELETIARKVGDVNARAWQAALIRSGLKVPALATRAHDVYDPADHKNEKRKAVAKFAFAVWGREQAAALMDFQKARGLKVTAVRDMATRAALRPVICYDPENEAASIAEFLETGHHPAVQLADRPVVMGWDSVAGTPTEDEMEGDARDVTVAGAAKVIRRNMRRLVQLIDNESIAFIVVNQRYAKIQTGRGGFSRGPASETYGGGGIKYHASLRIEVEKIGEVLPSGATPGEDPPLGQIVTIKVPKNKINDPFRVERFLLVFGRGAENAWAIYEDLKARGVVRMAGSWSKFTDPSILGSHDRNFRGWQELSNMMSEDGALWTRLAAIYHEGRR